MIDSLKVLRDLDKQVDITEYQPEYANALMVGALISRGVDKKEAYVLAEAYLFALDVVKSWKEIDMFEMAFKCIRLGQGLKEDATD